MVMGRFRYSRIQEFEGPRTVCSQNREIVNSKILKEDYGHGWFSSFWKMGVGGTRSFGELTCRSPKTPKHEKGVGSE